MKNDRLKILLDKRNNSIISAEEENELESMLISQWILDEKINDVDWENIYHNRIVKKRSKILNFKFAVAAAAILIACIGIIFLIKQNQWSNSNTVTSTTITQLSQIHGAKDQAILTVDNGNSLALENDSYLDIIDQIKDSDLNKIQTYTISTPKGNKYNFELPDGTQVWLNANSEITFPERFTNGERRITTKGEVFLEVTKSAIPFIILTNNIETKVLGTSLNINGYNIHKTITTLFTGKVLLSNEFDKQELVPGQGIEATVSLLTRIRPNLEKVISWKNDKFYFENENIQTILEELERWYDVEFVLDPNINKRSLFNGVIDRKLSLQQTLDILNFSTSLQLSTSNHKIIYVK